MAASPGLCNHIRAAHRLTWPIALGPVGWFVAGRMRGPGLASRPPPYRQLSESYSRHVPQYWGNTETRLEQKPAKLTRTLRSKFSGTENKSKCNLQKKPTLLSRTCCRRPAHACRGRGFRSDVYRSIANWLYMNADMRARIPKYIIALDHITPNNMISNVATIRKPWSERVSAIVPSACCSPPCTDQFGAEINEKLHIFTDPCYTKDSDLHAPRGKQRKAYLSLDEITDFGLD